MAPRRVIASAAMSAAGIIGTTNGKSGVVSGGFGLYLVIWICHWECHPGEARGGPAVAELSSS
jgi:hypothetical protein